MSNLQNTPVFINPFTDFGFKKIFGEEANKDLLIDFLNGVLSSENQLITELTYKNGEQLGESGIDRNVVFDLYCQNDRGEKFIVELQKAKQSFFKDRMLYYSSFSIQEQGKKGPWNYKLQKVYVIGILDFIIDEENKEKIVFSHNRLMDKDRKTTFSKKLNFVTLQMPNFTKEVDELETNFEKWLYVIKNLRWLENVPSKLQDKIFKKLFSVASFEAINKTEKEKYRESEKYYNDLKNSLDTAFEDGKKETEAELVPLLEEALAKEKEERRQKEEALGKEKETQFKLVLAMNKYRESFEEIAKETGLSIEEIKKIIDK